MKCAAHGKEFSRCDVCWPWIVEKNGTDRPMSGAADIRDCPDCRRFFDAMLGPCPCGSERLGGAWRPAANPNAVLFGRLMLALR